MTTWRSLLFFLVLLHITFEQDDPSQGIDSTYELMNKILPFFVEADRERFVKKCLEVDEMCDSEDVVGDTPMFKFTSPRINDESKYRLWMTYECVFTKRPNTCPVDGSWTQWTGWTKCSVPCGRGIRTRKRICDNPAPTYGGYRCSGFEREEEGCFGRCPRGRDNKAELEALAVMKTVHIAHPDLKKACFENHCTFLRVLKTISGREATHYWSALSCYKHASGCQVDGKWSQWGPWDECSARCGEGRKLRRRRCNSPAPAHGGFTCDPPHYEEAICFGHDCIGVPGMFHTEWSPWTRCSVSCGVYGLHKSMRICFQSPVCVSSTGQKKTLAITKPCFKGPCPAKGKWSEWLGWTPCGADCGIGRHSRIRQCLPRNSGRQIVQHLVCSGNDIETRHCMGIGKDCTQEQSDIPLSRQKRAEMSVPDDFERETDLTAVEILEERLDRGEDDLAFVEPLPVDTEIEYTSWSPWTVCSTSCGGGTRNRERLCDQEDSDHCYGEIRQTEYCNVKWCPVIGGWGDWLPWSVCSATCGKAFKMRFRRCDSPYPQYGGTCDGPSVEKKECLQVPCLEKHSSQWTDWSQWSECDSECNGGLSFQFHRCSSKNTACRGAERKATRCNLEECSKDGKWSSWNSWSGCTVTCGIGVRYRDRTCTDPAPSGLGSECDGVGTDVTHCFYEPCRGTSVTNIEAQFDGYSYLVYPPSGYPMRALWVLVRIRPISPDGVIIHRHEKDCKTLYCDSIVKLSLEHRFAVLIAHFGEAELYIRSESQVPMKEWTTIVFGLIGNKGFVRVGNRKHFLGVFNQRPKGAMDCDHMMTLGGAPGFRRDVNEHNFRGDIAALRVNYRPFAFDKSDDWIGHGQPAMTTGVTYEPATLEALYPAFQGNDFTYLSMPSCGLQIKMTVYPFILEGLLFFNKGKYPGSFIYLKLEGDAYVLCMSLGQSSSKCTSSLVVQLKRWYLISVEVEDRSATMRIDGDAAAQITLFGQGYKPRHTLYVAGGEEHDWAIFSMTTNCQQGFVGIIHSVYVNDVEFDFRRRTIIKTGNLLNGFGSTQSVHYRIIRQTPDNLVKLICDYTHYVKNGSYLPRVRWLKFDAILIIDEKYQLLKKEPGRDFGNVLFLKPSNNDHNEGFYACMVYHDGHYTLVNAYGVTYTGRGEVTQTDVATAETFLIAFCIVALALLKLFVLATVLYAKNICRFRDKVREIVYGPKAELIFQDPQRPEDEYEADLLLEEDW